VLIPSCIGREGALIEFIEAIKLSLFAVELLALIAILAVETATVTVTPTDSISAA
jgi:hypothetical protein